MGGMEAHASCSLDPVFSNVQVFPPALTSPYNQIPNRSNTNTTLVKFTQHIGLVKGVFFYPVRRRSREHPIMLSIQTFGSQRFDMIS